MKTVGREENMDEVKTMLRSTFTRYQHYDLDQYLREEGRVSKNTTELISILYTNLSM